MLLHILRFIFNLWFPCRSLHLWPGITCTASDIVRNSVGNFSIHKLPVRSPLSATSNEATKEQSQCLQTKAKQDTRRRGIKWMNQVLIYDSSFPFSLPRTVVCLLHSGGWVSIGTYRQHQNTICVVMEIYLERSERGRDDEKMLIGTFIMGEFVRCFCCAGEGSIETEVISLRPPFVALFIHSICDWAEACAGLLACLVSYS